MKRAPLSALLLPLLAPILVLGWLPPLQAARDHNNSANNYLSVAASPVDGSGTQTWTLFACYSEDSLANTDFLFGLCDSGLDNGVARLSVNTHNYTEDSAASATRIATPDAASPPNGSWTMQFGVHGGQTYRAATVAGVFSGQEVTAVTYANNELDTISVGSQRGAAGAAANPMDGPIARCAYWSTQLSAVDQRSVAYGVDPRNVAPGSLAILYDDDGGGTAGCAAVVGGSTYNLGLTGSLPLRARAPYSGIVGRKPVTPTINLDAMDVDSVGTSTDNTAVATWTNRGSLGGSFGQSTAGFKPLWRRSIARNGLPCLSFDGSDDLMVSSGFTLPTETSGEVWIVFEASATASAADHVLLGASDEGSPATLAYINFMQRQTASNTQAVKQSNNDVADQQRGAFALGTTGNTFLVRFASSGTAYTLYSWGSVSDTITSVTGANSGDWWGDCTGLAHLTVGAADGVLGAGASHSAVYIHQILVFPAALSTADAWDWTLTIGAKWFAGN